MAFAVKTQSAGNTAISQHSRTTIQTIGVHLIRYGKVGEVVDRAIGVVPKQTLIDKLQVHLAVYQ